MRVGSREIQLDDFVGVPWVGGGRDPETGFDCWGMLVSLYARAGVELPQFGNIAEPWELEALITGEKTDGAWVEVAKLNGETPPGVVGRRHRGTDWILWHAAAGGPRPLDVIELRMPVPRLDPSLPRITAHVGVIVKTGFPQRMLTTLSDSKGTPGSGGSFVTEYNGKWQRRTRAVYRHPALS